MVLSNCFLSMMPYRTNPYHQCNSSSTAMRGNHILHIPYIESSSYHNYNIFPLVFLSSHSLSFSPFRSRSDWHTSCIGRECLDGYTSSKFNLWKEQLLQAFGGCSKAFLPEIRRGYALTHMYDHMIFPFEDADKVWETEHHGKTLRLPRPIQDLRVWDPRAQTYEPLSPLMAGAPLHTDRDAYWLTLLDELRAALNPKSLSFSTYIIDLLYSPTRRTVTNEYNHKE